MIVTEHVIRSIIETLPSIDLSPSKLGIQPKFHWGDELELNRYIQKKKDASYPLIWLLPSSDGHLGGGQNAEKTCTFIIATREMNDSLFNDERYKLSFDLVLNPVTDYLVQGLTKSSLTSVNSREWETKNFPHYSADSEQNATIDKWDAKQLIIDVTFNGNDLKCLKTISYGT